MKTSTLSVTLLVTGCFLFLTQVTRAQGVSGYTTIDYDPDTNIVTAYSETDLDDYELECDYEAYVHLSVVDDSGVPLAWGSNRDYGDVYGYASITLQASGNPGTLYTGNGIHKLYVLL